jgi:hypothetical protein
VHKLWALCHLTAICFDILACSSNNYGLQQRGLLALQASGATSVILSEEEEVLQEGRTASNAIAVKRWEGKPFDA